MAGNRNSSLVEGSFGNRYTWAYIEDKWEYIAVTNVGTYVVKNNFYVCDPLAAQ